MNTESLRAFVLTATEGSMARAAPQLYLSVSALSRRIQDLERELGVKLFDRTSKGIRVTAVGTTLIDYATQVLDATAQVYAAAADSTATIPIRIGQPLGVDIQVRNTILGVLRESGLTYECIPGSNVQLIRQLSTGRLDMALLHQVPSSNCVPSRLVRRQEVKLTFSSSLPQSSITDLSLRHFRNQPFVISSAAMAGSPMFYAEIRSRFAEFGIDDVLDVGEVTWARDVVSSGSGFSIFVGSPASELESIRDYGLDVRAVDGLDMHLDTYLAWSTASAHLDRGTVDDVTRALDMGLYERPTLIRSVG